MWQPSVRPEPYPPGTTRPLWDPERIPDRKPRRGSPGSRGYSRDTRWNPAYPDIPCTMPGVSLGHQLLLSTFFPIIKEIRGWRERASNFPVLARMALCYLAIPATSNPSKRVLSKAKAVLTLQWASLLSRMLGALVCSKDWFWVFGAKLD